MTCLPRARSTPARNNLGARSSSGFITAMAIIAGMATQRCYIDYLVGLQRSEWHTTRPMIVIIMNTNMIMLDGR